MKSKDYTYTFFIESLIESNIDLSKFVYNTEIKDLKEGDIVFCSYLKKLHIVKKIKDKKSVIISPLNDRSETITVGASFLKIYDGNLDSIKILYKS